MPQSPFVTQRAKTIVAYVGDERASVSAGIAAINSAVAASAKKVNLVLLRQPAANHKPQARGSRERLQPQTETTLCWIKRLRTWTSAPNCSCLAPLHRVDKR